MFFTSVLKSKVDADILNVTCSTVINWDYIFKIKDAES